MNIKIKRFITIPLILVMLLNFISPITTYAVPEKEYLTFINYIKRIERNSGKEWLRPKPVITATTPTGETATEDGSTIPEDGSPYFTDRLNIPEPVLTVKVGTKINLDPNQSTVGSGTLIDNWDWQIYSPINPKHGFDYIKEPVFTRDKTTSFTPVNLSILNLLSLI